ncbi:Phosphomevalonate kinase [Punctularia strigosozonata HHB-11173 SS5]|uniref:Phosphomevalonate kinase n=1 Tax=Punctularia strigosozonata (strain HHB-11173) TaxID=741275 RepID=UPI0004416AFB|nr:Phosphomevalonate kinase [Punctularia strigosozonata HHB-11173 SS5]EIN11828.1 Phosphomevalonate kinase [Punctularia strigosozonata HHB-11173 SS5]
MASTSTVVSAPGKVLLAGGYLVLDPAYSGIVVSTSSRFYTSIQDAGALNPNSIRVRSPQFLQASWTYSVRFVAADGTVMVEQVVLEDSKNKFVHLALQRTLALAIELKGVAEIQNKLAPGLDIAIVGDNDFYSQRAQLAQLGLEPTIDSLSKLTPFGPTGVQLKDVHKTGLGSSAALITSLVTALLIHLDFLPRSAFADESISESRRLAHNVAQYVHCLAQGKVGSGFDVSSAVFGSQKYTRFNPAVLQPLMQDDLVPKLAPILSPSNPAWDYKVEPFQLPPSTRLMLADVDAGSDTPSLVGKVLKWRQAEPVKAAEVWNALDQANMKFAQALRRLSQLHDENPEDYDFVVRFAASLQPVQVRAIFFPMTSCLNTHAAYQEIRTKMREMGNLCGVPIEPPEQTALLDACTSQAGVIAGGVPGAGGYDAVWLLVLEPPQTADQLPFRRIERVWSTWKDLNVSPLSAIESKAKGIHLEDIDQVNGLRQAIHG